MNAQILTHNLSYAPMAGDEAEDSIYNPVEILKLSDESTSYAVDPFVFTLLKEGILVVKSSSSSKSILAGVQYVIVKPNDNGFEIKQYYVESLEEVKKLLQDGWKICRKSPQLGYVDVLVPNDSEHLISHIDQRARWRETIAAVINCEIESNTNWSTNHVFEKALKASVKDEEVIVNQSTASFSAGERVSSTDFVVASVLRGLEKHMNIVFEFIKNDQNALYVAEPSLQGINVCRYADVRALLWYKQTEEQRAAREQAIEDGLAS